MKNKNIDRETKLQTADRELSKQRVRRKKWKRNSWYIFMIMNGIHIQDNNNNKMQFDSSLVTWQLLF